MKKIISVSLTVLLCLVLLVPLTAVEARAASASLTGPGTVRAGDSITLSFAVSGTGIYGASGALSYDKDQVTLTGIKKKVASPWMVEQNGDQFVAYDNDLAKPIKSKTVLFTATFKVKASLKAGTTVKISCTNVKTSDGSKDEKLAAVSYSVKLAAPKSTNSDLKALSVTGGTLSPAFSADTASYSMTVPFSVSKLEVKATAADSKAKVSISGTALSVGSNTVTVTVTAESGAKQTYTIKVKREQDPNYVPSSNANLKDIKIDGYVLSPVFDPAVTEYLVWLPYETERITVSGTPADNKAKAEVQGGEALEAGKDNPVKVICTAEDGTTTKEYTILAKRAAPHGTPDDPVDPDPPVNDPPADDPAQPGGNQSGDGADQPGDGADQPGDVTVPEVSFGWYWLAGAGGVGLLLGLLLGRLTGKRKTSKH